MTKELYLDDSATTKTWKEVAEAVVKTMTENYGNPSSLHKKGEEAMDLLNNAREKLAGEIGAKSWEIYFTSGGTESDNWAIQGLAKQNPDKKKIVVSTIEHPVIMETCDFMKTQGYEIIKIPVDKSGFLDLERLEKELGDDVLVVSVIHANNIFGTIQNIREIGKLCRKHRILFHTDAVQSFGKLDIDVERFGIDLLSASAHKIGGPKGIGFLYVKEKTKIKPLIHGGGQEKGLRSGTENVPGVVGFAKSLDFYKKADKEKIKKLRSLLMNELEKIGGKINGSKEQRLYNNVHVSFPGVDNDSLVMFLSEKSIYVSAGSACDSKKEKEDYVLKALCLNDKEAKSSIRITLGFDFKEEDISYIVSEIQEVLKKLKIHR